MSAKNISLWVSCLALGVLLASCSGMAGSPIQGDLDAASNSSSDSLSSNNDAAQLPAISDLMGAAAGDKGVSYTPGLPCPLLAGTTFPSVLKYGWKYGNITEGALAPSVTLNGM